jgi:hypothetical protein
MFEPLFTLEAQPTVYTCLLLFRLRDGLCFQVHELLGQNQELRAALRQVREEQRAAEEARSVAPDAGGQENQGKDMVPAVEVEEVRAQEAKLKVCTGSRQLLDNRLF